MKFRTIVALVCLCAGAAMAQTAAPARPAATAGNKVGVIDLHAAILDTQQGKQRVAAIRAEFDPRQAKLKQGAGELQAMQQKLQQGTGLTDQQKSDLEQQIATKQRDLQRLAEDTQNDFNKARDQMESDLIQKMAQLIDDYARTHGYTMILDVSQPWPGDPVLYASQETNLSETMVRLYDSKYPVAATSAKPPTK